MFICNTECCADIHKLLTESKFTMKKMKIFLTLVVLSFTASMAFAADSPAAADAAKPAAIVHPYTGKLAPKLSRAEQS